MWGYGANNSRSSPDVTINTANVAGLTLKFKWTQPAAPPGCSTNETSSPAIANGVAYVEFSFTVDPFACAAGGGLAAFDASTGATLWTHMTPFSYPCPVCEVAAPAVVNGIVYDRTSDAHLDAFNASTGSLVWSEPGTYWGPPTVDNGIVYIIDGTENVAVNLTAYNATTGALVWTRPGSAGLPPAVANGIVYTSALSAPNLPFEDFVAYNAATGAFVWRVPSVSSSAMPSPAVVNGIVYVSAMNDQQIDAFNATTGAVVWTATGIGAIEQLAVANGIVYTGDYRSGALYALNATTGSILWTTTTAGNGFFDAPAVANGIVFIHSHGALSTTTSLYAFNATTGAALWSATAGTVTQGQQDPVVANGVVYVGSANGKVYAFGLP
jgi:outer membrane protein assembly factor BamB